MVVKINYTQYTTTKNHYYFFYYYYYNHYNYDSLLHNDIMMQITTRKPTLVDILNNETSYPYSLDDFATFLDQTYCLENLEFWIEVRRYRYLASNFFNSNSTTPLLM